MTDADKHERRFPALAAVLCVVVLLLPVVYVLSIGPAFWLMEHGYASSSVWEYTYYPVFWLSSKSELGRRLLEWYINLWR